MQSKLFLTDDPALVVLYKQLREKSLQTLRGALSVSPRAEWQFILHTAGLYQRMGCDLLALDLVKTWEFLTPPTQPPPTSRALSPRVESPNYSTLHPLPIFGQSPLALQGFDIDPHKVLRRRSSLVVADLPLVGRRRSAVGDGSAIEEEEKERNGVGVDTAVNEAGKKEEKVKAKPPPTQFQEPDANSLLDSFGF
jgi:hypothetical protein